MAVAMAVVGGVFRGGLPWGSSGALVGRVAMTTVPETTVPDRLPPVERRLRPRVRPPFPPPVVPSVLPRFLPRLRIPAGAFPSAPRRPVSTGGERVMPRPERAVPALGCSALAAAGEEGGGGSRGAEGPVRRRAQGAEDPAAGLWRGLGVALVPVPGRITHCRPCLAAPQDDGLRREARPPSGIASPCGSKGPLRIVADRNRCLGAVIPQTRHGVQGGRKPCSAGSAPASLAGWAGRAPGHERHWSRPCSRSDRYPFPSCPNFGKDRQARPRRRPVGCVPAGGPAGRVRRRGRDGSLQCTDPPPNGGAMVMGTIRSRQPLWGHRCHPRAPPRRAVSPARSAGSAPGGPALGVEPSDAFRHIRRKSRPAARVRAPLLPRRPADGAATARSPQWPISPPHRPPPNPPALPTGA